MNFIDKCKISNLEKKYIKRKAFNNIKIVTSEKKNSYKCEIMLLYM